MYKLIILYTLWRTITTARGTEGGFSLSFRVRAVHGGKNNIYIHYTAYFICIESLFFRKRERYVPRSRGFVIVTLW